MTAHLITASELKHAQSMEEIFDLLASARGWSENTRLAYWQDWQNFLGWLGERDITELTSTWRTCEGRGRQPVRYSAA